MHGGEQKTAPGGEQKKTRGGEQKTALRTITNELDLAELKNIYGEFKNVQLTQEEYDKLTDHLGEDSRDDYIEQLSRYVVNKKRDPYTNHYAAIRAWVRKAEQKQRDRRKTVTVIG